MTPTPNINASATAKVLAKPDVAIVFMTIRIPPREKPQTNANDA